MLFFAVLSSVILVLVLFYRRKRHNEFWRYILAIPQPETYPIVGLLDILLMKDPVLMFEITLERMKKFFPIVALWSFGAGIVMTASPDDAEKILTSMKHLKKGQAYYLLEEWLGTGLLTSTDSKWQARRKMLTPAFHFSILQNFLDVFNKETEHLVEQLAILSKEPYIDVIKPITEFTLSSIGETSLGIKLDKHPNVTSYKSSIHEFGILFGKFLLRPWLMIRVLYKLSPLSREIKKVVDVLHSFSSNIIENRKKEYKSGSVESYSQRKRLALLDLLLKSKYEDGFDIDDKGIREEVDTFMFEGHDTTSMAICFSLLVLANEPKYQEEILQEILDVLGDKQFPDTQDLAELKFMERCIKECLRLYPSVPIISRILGEDIKLPSGYDLGKGMDVNVTIYAMHHSDQVWEDPEKFNPDRFLPENVAGRHPFAYIPFSAGPRNCIGQKFAMFEMKAALCGILRNFELKPVHKREDIKIKLDLVLRPAGEVRVKFIPRRDK